MTRNIAIVGKMYAGKTTLATQLVNDHGYTRVLMAGPLKMLAHLAYGEEIKKDKEYSVTDMWSGMKIEKTGREILQGIGQSLKVVDRDIWLKCFIEDTTRMSNEPYVVDDVRFAFEAGYLRAQGWLIVKIDTPEHVRIERAVALSGKAPTDKELNHESEAEVDSIRFDINVPGDMDLAMMPEIAKAVIAE
jgi:dephospho-CoA kinase